MFFIKIWRHIFNLLIFFYYFHQKKYSMLFFLKQLLQNKLCFFLWRIHSVHPSLWVAGQVFCLVIRFVIKDTSDRFLVEPPCLPRHLCTSMRFWMWKAHQWMMWITVHLHQRCCQDKPNVTTTSMKMTPFRSNRGSNIPDRPSS